MMTPEQLSGTEASRLVPGAMGFVDFQDGNHQYESELITSPPARVDSC